MLASDSPASGPNRILQYYHLKSSFNSAKDWECCNTSGIKGGSPADSHLESRRFGAELVLLALAGLAVHTSSLYYTDSDRLQ